MKKYTVTLANSDGDIKDEVSYKTFDKSKIEDAFIKFCEKSEPGDEVEYWKQDRVWFYNPLLTVENKKGVIMRLVIKGDKCYYVSFNWFGKKQIA